MMLCVPVLPSGSAAWFWSPGPGPWFWPLVPLAQASCSTAAGLVDGFIVYVICEWILPLWWTFSDHHCLPASG